MPVPLLGLSLALPVAGAQADIKPLPKPAVVSPTPDASNRGPADRARLEAGRVQHREAGRPAGEAASRP